MNMKNLFTILVANVLLISCTAQKRAPLELNPAFNPIRTSTLNERYEKALRDLEALPFSAEKFAVDGFTVVMRSTDNSLGDVARANVTFGFRVDEILPVSYVIAPYDENVVTATQSVCAVGSDALLVTTNNLTPVLNVSGGTRNTPEISPDASVSNVDPKELLTCILQ
jgi:hypothetical protein